MTVKTIAQTRLSTSAARIQSFLILSSESSSVAVDGSADSVSVVAEEGAARSLLLLLLPMSTLRGFLYVTRRHAGDGDADWVIQRHAASLLQKRFLICYVQQRNSRCTDQLNSKALRYGTC